MSGFVLKLQSNDDLNEDGVETFYALAVFNGYFIVFSIGLN